jgi:hypothetical protein
MLVYSFNGAGFGNAVFSQYSAILFTILFDAEIVDIKDRSEIDEFRNTAIDVDDAYFMNIVNAKIDRNETIIDLEKNYFLIGYYQHDHYYVKYKKEIIAYIERHPNRIVIADHFHYSGPYKLINIIETKPDEKIYDIVIHLRLGDFIKIAWTMNPKNIVDVIKTLYIDKETKVAIVVKESNNKLEKKYIEFILSHLPENTVVESNEYPITDYNIMRNAKVLVCSCSTFSWVASFMGCENQMVYFPNYQSRWNHEQYRKPHDMVVYYEFNRCSEIDLWTMLF